MEIIAFKDIGHGEEVLVSCRSCQSLSNENTIVNPFADAPLGMPSNERRKLLREWGFRCSCTLYSSSYFRRAQSDDNRRRIVGIRRALDHYKDIEPNRLIDLIHDLLQLLTIEELTVRMGDYYDKIANIYLDLNDEVQAKKFGELALDFWTF